MTAPIESWPRREIQRGRRHDGDAPHAVYSIFDEADQVIYVGMSHDPESRLRSHLRQSWGHEAHSWSADWYRTRADAAQAEAALIRELEPKHNLFGTSRQAEFFRRIHQRDLRKD